MLSHEYALQMELEQMKIDTVKDNDKFKEDRKDERTRIHATQQSEMIDQRNKQKPPKKFDKSSDDIGMDEFNLDKFNAI